MSTTSPQKQLSLTEAFEDAQDAAEAAPAEATLPCGHERSWLESGSCMACEPAWMTAQEREAREELDLTRQPGDYV